MHVGDVQQRDVAERFEREKFGLCQALLRESAREARGARAAVAAATCRNSRRETMAVPSCPAQAGTGDSGVRHVTLMVSSPTMVEPSSSCQVSTTGPDSVGLELELDVRVRRHRQLELGGEHLLAGDRADELVEDLARDRIALRILALARSP